MKEKINIVWFKRDLRLSDHSPLQLCIENNLPTILLYIFEPSLIAYPDSDTRHWRFVYESLLGIEKELASFKACLNIANEEAINAFEKLATQFNIDHIYSHEEIGNKLSYERDKTVKIFCKENNISWIETPTNGITRGLKNRNNFAQNWHTIMHSPIITVLLEKLKSIEVKNLFSTLESNENFYKSIATKNNKFQPGGEINANAYLKSFLYERKSAYSKQISKPLASRKSCSRLSPYLAWGNLSMRQIYQAALIAIKDTGDKHNINFFISRLHWHCHFIQKFESECRMEFENLNKGFDAIRTSINEEYINAWKNGTTGYPLIDACMKAVTETGYLNFRMRSMLVSFLTHNLWQPWQVGAHHLAKQFLDYEPGIHYPQFQMQAGTMGLNTIRTYNPTKNAQEHDPEGLFIKQWLPALQTIPTALIYEPWTMTEAEQEIYNCKLGIDYPMPIVNLQDTARYARIHLWGTKKTKKVMENNEQILDKHVKQILKKAKSIVNEKAKLQAKEKKIKAEKKDIRLTFDFK